MGVGSGVATGVGAGAGVGDGVGIGDTIAAMGGPPLASEPSSRPSETAHPPNPANPISTAHSNARPKPKPLESPPRDGTSAAGRPPGGRGGGWAVATCPLGGAGGGCCALAGAGVGSGGAGRVGSRRSGRCTAGGLWRSCRSASWTASARVGPTRGGAAGRGASRRDGGLGDCWRGGSGSYPVPWQWEQRSHRTEALPTTPACVCACPVPPHCRQRAPSTMYISAPLRLRSSKWGPQSKAAPRLL